MTDIGELTKKRRSVYGPFRHNAAVAQNIKMAMRQLPTDAGDALVIGPAWGCLPADIREALDLMAIKIARILTGEPEYLDNWDDIGGYAKIVADRIRGSGA